MGELRYGFTNHTRRLEEGLVRKDYLGLDRFDRAAVERACLVRLRGRLAIPEIVRVDRERPSLVTKEAVGQHGQDLVDAGRAIEVLDLLGTFLHELARLPVATVPELAGTGAVLVHGDFGPQNVIVADGQISAVLDWEFAHRGTPIEDLAWVEWIIRMHHPGAIEALGALHQGAQLHPDWAVRHAAMVDRCRSLLAYCERSGQHHGVEIWRDRLAATEGWVE